MLAPGWLSDEITNEGSNLLQRLRASVPCNWRVWQGEDSILTSTGHPRETAWAQAPRCSHGPARARSDARRRPSDAASCLPIRPCRRGASKWRFWTSKSQRISACSELVKLGEKATPILVALGGKGRHVTVIEDFLLEFPDDGFSAILSYGRDTVDTNEILFLTRLFGQLDDRGRTTERAVDQLIRWAMIRRTPELERLSEFSAGLSDLGMSADVAHSDKWVAEHIRQRAVEALLKLRKRLSPSSVEILRNAYKREAHPLTKSRLESIVGECDGESDES